MDNNLRNSGIVRRWGSVLLGDKVRCDGEANGDEFERRFACFSHIHPNHIQGFEEALTQCEAVLVTEATKDLLTAKLGEFLKIKSNLKSLTYGQPYNNALLDGESITLFDSGHILGSCQVLVEDNIGNRILYSSDFNMPGADIPKDIDLLILDSTNGIPSYDSGSDRNELETKIVKLVKEELENLKPVVIRSITGQMQYLMHLITKNIGSRVPLISKEVDRRLALVYRKYGYLIEDVIADESDEFHGILKRDDLYVRFLPLSGSLPYELQGTRTIIVGSQQEYNIQETNKVQVNHSNHATFRGILDYVSKVAPKKGVITDNSIRSKPNTAISLATEIKRKLSIDAFYEPS